MHDTDIILFRSLLMLLPQQSKPRLANQDLSVRVELRDFSYSCFYASIKLQMQICSLYADHKWVVVDMPQVLADEPGFWSAPLATVADRDRHSSSREDPM